MKNPWTKKNPYLSMWLSGANAVAGSIRGHAAKEARRQTHAAIQESTRQMMAFWTGAAPPKRRRRKKTK